MLRSGVLLLACALLLVACGSSKTEEDKIRENVRSFLDGFRAGDGEKVCSLLTARGRKDVVGGVSGSCADAVHKEAKSLDAAGTRALRKARISKVQFQGGTVATAYVDFGVKDSPLAPFRMVKHGGDWLISGPATS